MLDVWLVADAKFITIAQRSRLLTRDDVARI